MLEAVLESTRLSVIGTGTGRIIPKLSVRSFASDHSAGGTVQRD